MDSVAAQGRDLRGVISTRIVGEEGDLIASIGILFSLSAIAIVSRRHRAA